MTLLRERLQPTLSERECVAYALSLIDDSLGSWKSLVYDYYQYYTNSISF